MVVTPADLWHCPGSPGAPRLRSQVTPYLLPVLGTPRAGRGLLGPGAARTHRHGVVAAYGRRRDLKQDTGQHVLALFRVEWKASPTESSDAASCHSPALQCLVQNVLSTKAQDRNHPATRKSRSSSRVPVESRGPTSCVDFRALCCPVSKHTPKMLCLSVFEEPEDPSSRSFFSEIISSISDVKFSHSGRYMMTRDYLSVKVWDLNMESRPVETHQVRPRLGTAPRPQCHPLTCL